MHKRVLVAEESDTIRSVTESILRQNGYEVISVTSGDRALEVLTYTKPDFVLLASSMVCKGNKALYERIQDEPKFSHIPHMVMVNEGDPDLMLPEEIILTKPFEPKDLMRRIKVFTGAEPGKPQPAQGSDPQLGDSDLDDDLLDMALGIDQFEVTDSEEMGKTSGIQIKKKKKAAEKMVGYDHVDPDTEVHGDSGKVESLMIHDDESEIQQSQKKTGKQSAGTGKLEILNDQFGLIDSEPFEQKQGGGDHDYEWFLNELQKEESGQTAEGAPSKSPQQAKSKKAPAEPDELSFEETSSYVDPVTPPKQPQENPAPGAGVDNFIDEFKKEIEKIGTDITDSVTIDEQGNPAKNENMSWEDSIEKINPQEMALFKKQFVETLAMKIAKIITDKIDADKLLVLLKQEIIKQAQKK